MLCALVMFLGFIIAPTSAYPTGKVVEVTEADFDAQVAKGPTLVDVYADWCGHCRQLAPVWEELVKELEGEVYVVKVNGPKCRSLQQRLHVKAYPTILYLRDGEMRSYDGAQRTVQALAAFARKGWRSNKPVPFYMAPNSRYANRSDADADDTYFDSYSNLGIHREMLGDAARTGAYLDAIEAHRPQIEGKVVLDVGCGTGILSMFAARCGARKVYAVDASGITRHTRRLVKDNGFDGIIEVITGKMEDVDIPEKVDVIISEWMGYALLFESMLPSVVEARDRFLAPGGLVLPNKAAVKVALLSDEDRWDDAVTFWVTFWEDVYGLDFSSLIPQANRDWHADRDLLVQTVPAAKLASAPVDAVEPIDCTTTPLDDLYEPIAGDVRMVATRTCDVHGLVLWFDVDFYGKVKLSTGPDAAATHWYQTVLMFDEPVAMAAGDALCGTIELEPGSNPGERRTLNVYFNYGVVEGGKEEEELVEPDDRERFQRWTVQ